MNHVFYKSSKTSRPTSATEYVVFCSLISALYRSEGIRDKGEIHFFMRGLLHKCSCLLTQNRNHIIISFSGENLATLHELCSIGKDHTTLPFRKHWQTTKHNYCLINYWLPWKLDVFATSLMKSEIDKWSLNNGLSLYKWYPKEINKLNAKKV